MKKNVVIVCIALALFISCDSKASEAVKGNVTAKAKLQEKIKRAIAENGKNADLNHINTSDVTDMSKLFRFSTFNGDISKWDTSSVTDMRYMFSGATAFNQSLNSWDVSKVTNYERYVCRGNRIQSAS